MGDLNVIDSFVATFTAYIDSGFGLLAPDVAFLTAILIGIDIVLAGLFWSLGSETNVIGQFLKKVLYVGAFAFIINNFSFLSNVIFSSFAQLGLNATGGTLTAADLLKPGFVANTGYTAAYPLLDEVGGLLGPIAFFENFVLISILMLAWLIVLLAFFILAIQLFITIIEFKLTTLAGFILVPFALWNKTSFLAERVLGNVISSGVKLMVLAVIVGIGSTIFGSITGAFTPGAITLEEAASVILASLSMLALGVFGPAIANGLVSGAPQLGAGAAVGTIAGVGAGALAGGAIAYSGIKAAASGARSAVSSGASLAGGAHASYAMGRSLSGSGGWRGAASGVSSMASAGAGAAMSSMRKGAARMFGDPGASYSAGARAAFEGTGGKAAGSVNTPSSVATAAPQWARNLKREQFVRDAGLATTQAIRDGDRPVSGDSPKLKQDDD
ncbi:P-type conjugative transfer protein TrbL [Hyphococcus sp.]|uniref:P-type conjugative transfer protein TrbL n=1 Tax=Hyphococcus sp. TaxID=2038636 RepID=UPI003CCC1118